LFGNLFKSETRSRKKTNLMVFLRPVVVRDAQKSDELSLDRYELMRGLQQGGQPAKSIVFPVNTAPVLPPPTRGLPVVPEGQLPPPKAPPPPVPALPDTSNPPNMPNTLTTPVAPSRAPSDYSH
jgi:general secretion pathway protein D